MSIAIRISSRVLVITVAVLALAGSSTAAPITWVFTGPVDRTHGVLINVIPVGTPATATVTIESTAVSHFSGCGPGTGGIFDPVSAVLSVGDFNVPYPYGFVMINTTGAGCGSSGSAEFIFGGGRWPSIGEAPGGAIGPEMRMLTRAFDGTALTLGEVMGTPQGAFFIVQGVGGSSLGSVRFSGALVQQAAPVPEPGTMILFGTGALFAARAARRKRVV